MKAFKIRLLILALGANCSFVLGQNVLPPSGNVGINNTIPGVQLTIGAQTTNTTTNSTVKLQINEDNPYIELRDATSSIPQAAVPQLHCGIRFTTVPNRTYEIRSFSTSMMGQGLFLLNNAQNFGVSLYDQKMFLGSATLSGAPMSSKFGDVNIAGNGSAHRFTVIDNNFTAPVLATGYAFGVYGKSIFTNTVAIGGQPSAFNNSFPGTYKLYVKDGILAERVRVAIVGSSFWADYVFDKHYELMPINEVDKFIQKNKHLPGVPSAEEVYNNGLDVATMDATLLKKIEELTLYIIEMENRLKELESKDSKGK